MWPSRSPTLRSRRLLARSKHIGVTLVSAPSRSRDQLHVWPSEARIRTGLKLLIFVVVSEYPDHGELVGGWPLDSERNAIVLVELTS